MSHVCFRRLAAACIGMTLLLASGITGLTAKSTASQDAGVPQSWECFVEPVGLVSLLEIMNQLDEVEGSGIQEPVDAAFITPGEALRSVDQDGITQATWELAACINARDPFRLAALLTPELQARLVVDLLEGTGVEALGDQLPILDQIDPDQDLAEIPITAAWYSPFSPHEIEAVLSPQIEGLEEQRQFLVRFVYSDGRWLIDDMRVITGSVPGAEEGAHGIEGDAEATPSDETVVPQTTAEASPVGSPAADTVTVTSVDIAFEPTEVTITADTDVTFMLPNEGAAPHNFSIDELDISVDIAPGETAEVVINAPAGEYEFYCNVPGHREAGMVGTLIVSGDASVAESPAAEESEAGSGAEPVTVASHDIRFEPAELTIPADTDVTVALPNEGAAPHNFSIDELSIDVDIDAGAEEEVVINAPAGEYEFYCNVPGHREAGMVGTLTVE